MFGRQNLQLITPIASAVALCAYVCYFYFEKGFVVPLLIGWAVAILLGGFGFYRLRSSSTEESLIASKKDILLIAAILILASPFYLAFLYEIPVQVNTDEPGDCMVSFWHTSKFEKPNLFSLTGWWGLPAFQFILSGWVARAMGGVTLHNLRLIQALIALLGIAWIYVLSRLLTRSRFAATASAIFVAFNHGFLGIARMAMRNVDVVLTLSAACSLLWISLQRRCLFYAYLGGVVIGFSYYLYYPGRLSLPIWAAYLILLALFYRRQFQIGSLSKLFAATVCGWALVIAPHFVAATLQPDHLSLAREYTKRTFLFSTEAQQAQMSHFKVATPSDGIWVNIRNGLTVFNNDIGDQSTTYPNPNYGFVDPLSGILLWIGFIATVAGGLNAASLLSLLGFLVCWLVPTFLVTLSPHYPRLLGVLPFASLLVGRGAWVIWGAAFPRLLKRFSERTAQGLSLVGFVATLGAIVFLNLLAYKHYVMRGLHMGDDLGAAVRYVEDRRSAPDMHYYLVGDADFPLFPFGHMGGWRLWVGASVINPDNMFTIKSSELESTQFKAPFALFINETLWSSKQGYLKQKYPGLKSRDLSVDGKLMLVEYQSSP